MKETADLSRSMHPDDEDLSELRTIPFERGGFDLNLDCDSPTSNSNPILSGYDWQKRSNAMDQKLMEPVSPVEISFCIAIGCEWWLDVNDYECL